MELSLPVLFWLLGYFATQTSQRIFLENGEGKTVSFAFKFALGVIDRGLNVVANGVGRCCKQCNPEIQLPVSAD